VQFSALFSFLQISRVGQRGRLFLSLPLLVYAGAVAIFFHLLVIGYEEPTLLRRFGKTYAEYRRTVPRWIPRPPRHG
jgi:protein-S-isoprenylcysteine O-methyltransferase Ste14